MSAQEREAEALAQAAHGCSLAHFDDDGTHIGDCVLVRDLPKVLALRPVPAAGEVATEDVIERAARVLAQLEPGEDWPSNAALGGSLTGTRDDEYRDAMIGQARDLARAGLLAGGVPGRSVAEIKAEALREAADDIERNSLPSIKRNGMDVRFAVMLRARADQITNEGDE